MRPMLNQNIKQGCALRFQVQLAETWAKGEIRAQHWIERRVETQLQKTHVINVFHMVHKLSQCSSLIPLPPPCWSSSLMTVGHQTSKLHMPKHSIFQALPESTINFTWILINCPNRAKSLIKPNLKNKVKWLIGGIKVPDVRALIPRPLSYIVVTDWSIRKCTNHVKVI